MSEFRMPSLGADMEAGTLVEWFKEVGDEVRRGDTIALVETQKGAIEIEVFEEGIVTELLIAPGTKVPVGTPMAMIAEKTRRIADAATAALGPTTGAQPMPRPSSGRPTHPLAPSPARRISPAARRIAAERHIDIDSSAFPGSGPGGAIVSRDIGATRDETAQAPRLAPRQADQDGMRRAIAAAMSRSKREIPHYYLWHEVDVTSMGDWLRKTNADREPGDRILPAACLLRAVAKAIGPYPEMNGFHVDGRHVPSKSVHIGTAISIRGGGLIAPAIHDVERLGIDEVMRALRDLTVRARGNRLRSSELSGPTITVSALGDRGVDGVLASIYPPQVAIVGFGTPRVLPWVIGDMIEPRRIMSISLAADHRVSDGHRGALFLSEIADHLETPEAL